MDEGTHRKWDTIIKTIGIVGLLLSGAWTYYKYRDDRRVDLEHQVQAIKREADARNKELNAFIFQKQAQAYLDMSNVTAVIAYSTDEKELHEAKVRFHELYFGELAVVEDYRVRLAENAFHECFERQNDKPCVRGDTTTSGKPVIKRTFEGDTTEQSEQALAEDLSACIRSALEHGRGIKLSDTPDISDECPYD